MFILLSLFFKTIPPKKIAILQNQKYEKSDALLCGEHYDYILENFSSQSLASFVFCKTINASLLVANCRFINCHIDHSHGSFFIQYQYSNAEIRNSTFDSITYKDGLVGLYETDARYFSNFYSNHIKHCYNYAKQASVLFNSYYRINDVQNNTFIYNEIQFFNPIFNFNYYGKCKFIGNSILNANHETTSVALFKYQEQKDNEFILSDCVFTNCRGSFGSTIVILDCTLNLTFKNLTFQNTTNNFFDSNGLGRGYFFRIDRVGYAYEVRHTYVDFVNCTFSKLTCNGQGSGGYGVFIRKRYIDSIDMHSFEIFLRNTTFEDLYFTNSKYGGGAISLSHEDDENRFTQLFISGCTFNNISCTSGGGGAIYFNAPSRKLTIEQTEFRNIGSQKVGFGGCIYIKHQSDPMPIIINDCYFENTTSNEGGAIYIDWNPNSESLVSIERCTFYKTSSKSNGQSIVVSGSKSNEVLISNCAFNDCGFNATSFTVIVDAYVLNFTDNSVAFSEPEKSCGCLELKQIERYFIFGNSFRNAICANDTLAAGINIFSTQENYSLIIVNNTFDNIGGNDNGICISIQGTTHDGLVFRNNTIENVNNSGTLIKFVFHSRADLFVFESCNFVNNKHDKSTPQIWIEFVFESDSDSLEFEILYENCLFENCTSLTKSGGLYHDENLIKNTKLSLFNCNFTGNTAKNTGGAISVHAYQGCEIENCVFIRNRSEEGSGAIHIETNFEYRYDKNYTINIFGSKFEENEGNNANCIYITNSPNEQIHIYDCSFKDCGKYGYVISLQLSGISIIIENNSIYFTKDLNSLRTIGINSCTDKMSLIENTFQNFLNAVVHVTCLSNGHNQFELIDNIFINSSKHTLFYFENILTMSPIIKGNTFKRIRILDTLFSFRLNNNIDEINFDNNTFYRFYTNSIFGGVGLDLNHRDKEVPFHLHFNDCFFSYFQNSGTSEQRLISCSTNVNNGNVDFSIIRCNFESNYNKQDGISLYFDTQRDIQIRECNFLNSSGNGIGNIYFDLDVFGEITKGSIYIVDCNFTRNQINYFYSIFLHTGSTKKINIKNCSFEDKGICVLRPGNNVIIEHNIFHEINKYSALYLVDNYDNSDITINNCIFDSCSATIFKCFKILIRTSFFKFENNIIQNNKETGYESYIGLIKCNEPMQSLEIKNNSFINNVCDSLYGGGIGLQISGVQYLSFIDCIFDNNTAKQSTAKSRPIQHSKKAYYNGDGGCIQIGYTLSFNNFYITFHKCYFKNNKAERHGGAIAIQTIWDVNISNCIFENNVANYRKSSVHNLAKKEDDNYYDKKKEGRGGAIYINPTSSYDEETSSFKAPANITSIRIIECRFIKNSAFDGYAFYIEGDKSIQDAIFEIDENRFIDNYNENNYKGNNKDNIYGAVISTEIFNIQEKKLINDNSFRYTNKNIQVTELSYVDHYGKSINSQNKSSNSNKTLIIILTVVIIIIAVVLISIFVFFIKKKKDQKETEMRNDNLIDESCESFRPDEPIF